MVEFKLGDKVKAKDILVRSKEYIKPLYDKENRFWVRWGDRPCFNPKPVVGMLVGLRTYQNGVNYLVDPHESNFIPSEYIQVALIVEGVRRNPVPVLVEDLEYL